MNWRFPYFVLACICWWPFPMAADVTREVCDLVRETRLDKGLDDQPADFKELVKPVKCARTACNGFRYPKDIKAILVKGLDAFEVITGCVYAGHVLECLVAFDVSTNDLYDRLRMWQDGSGAGGFVDRSHELWQAWRYETMPLLSAMITVLAKWTVFLRNMFTAYRQVLPVSADQHDLLDAVESLNLYLNGKALEPTQLYTGAHEAYTRVGLVHAYLYQKLYKYFNGHGCSRQAWTGSPWRPNRVEPSIPTRSLVRQRVRTAVGALKDFYTKTALEKIGKVYKVQDGQLAVTRADMIELNQHPDLFVRPGNVVVWLWNGVKTNVYHVFAGMQNDYRDDTAQLYDSLMKRTIVASFLTYVYQYLHLYVHFFTVKDADRFAKDAQNDPTMLKPIRTIINKMAFFSEDYDFRPIIRIHNRITAPPKHSGTLSVYDLQLMIRGYLSVLQYTLEVHMNPILVDSNNVMGVMDEYVTAMSFGLKWEIKD